MIVELTFQIIYSSNIALKFDITFSQESDMA